MQHPERFRTSQDIETTQTRSSDFLTQCHRNALDRLRGSFRRESPLAILLGDGKSTARFVIRAFLTRLDDDVSVVRIVGPCTSATDFMKQVVTAIGFQPKDMSLADLDSIFSMFLSFQKAHSKRTVVCVEEAQECDWWVLDKIRSMVETERSGDFGLMVVLAGQRRFTDMLSQRPLDSIASYAGKRISLSPFTLPETREYLRHRVEALGKTGIDEVLDFHAIGLIHELGSGVPDSISELFGECLRQADVEGIELVTKELVQRAYAVQRDSASEPFGDDEAAETITADRLFPPPGRLVVQLTGHDLREVRLRRSNILIGRSKLCDVRIDSKIVSRHHALIRYTSQGAILIDLGSTNGTKVDGYSVKEHSLVGGETIAVGDCLIEYLLEDSFDGRIEDLQVSMKAELGS